MNYLAGTEARQPGWIAKKRLRDFLSTELRSGPNSGVYNRYGGIEFLLVQQIEGEIVPNGKPLVAIGTSVERDRREADLDATAGTIDGWQHDFQLEFQVKTDANSGGLVTSDNEAPLGELLSDDIDDVLSRRGAEAQLEALGIYSLRVGKRRESTDSGIHTNRHNITFCVYAEKN